MTQAPRAALRPQQIAGIVTNRVSHPMGIREGCRHLAISISGMIRFTLWGVRLRAVGFRHTTTAVQPTSARRPGAAVVGRTPTYTGTLPLGTTQFSMSPSQVADQSGFQVARKACFHFTASRHGKLLCVVRVWVRKVSVFSSTPHARRPAGKALARRHCPALAVTASLNRSFRLTIAEYSRCYMEYRQVGVPPCIIGGHGQVAAVAVLFFVSLASLACP